MTVAGFPGNIPPDGGTATCLSILIPDVLILVTRFGTEHVNVRGTLPITGPGAVPRGFLRVAVEKP